ncbi:LysR family transcriptional regulator [Methylobacterium sp. E-046]|uniref:LysR family transcriptional regulator n=1 Tax=Methylobacterium sp. E-046 TaxID=2836576 RepID=UPI001FB8CA14|nr:LysR family transcriptional regulator [Methylobacterium sp. E-046]MCJ2103512.1 LysR family transcriptional regulator [Methylobacterium sp. E-046]
MIDPFDSILTREQIRTLLSVVEQGSFHSAAALLGVRQPAITQLVRRLEEKLGRRLFDRTPAGVHLTVDGEAVLIYARAMAKLGADMSRQFSLPARHDTLLRIGIGEEFGRTALPAVLALFARLHPGFRFEAVCALPSQTLFKILDDGNLDVVVARQDPARRSGEIIWTAPTIWIARSDLALSRADPLPLVLPAAGVLRDNVLTTLAAASRTWRIVFGGGSMAILEAAIQAGLGVSACTPRTKIAHVTPVDAKEGLPSLPQSVFVFERKSPTRSEEVEAFCGVLQTAAQLSFSDDRVGADQDANTCTH